MDPLNRLIRVLRLMAVLPLTVPVNVTGRSSASPDHFEHVLGRVLAAVNAAPAVPLEVIYQSCRLLAHVAKVDSLAAFPEE